MENKRFRRQLVMFNKIITTFFISLIIIIPASAHPLGNFSVNTFTRVEVEKNQVRLKCVLDLAEIPTFQELQKIDADKNGSFDSIELNNYLESLTPRFVANLNLLVDNRSVQIE